MKNPPSSVVRRGTAPTSLGKPLVQPLSPSVVYHYEDADQLEAVYEGRETGSPMRAKATRMHKACLTSCRGWNAPLRVS